MGPEWYFAAYEYCRETHDPEEWEGREWDDLSAQEQDDCVNDHVLGVAD